MKFLNLLWVFSLAVLSGTANSQNRCDQYQSELNKASKNLKYSQDRLVKYRADLQEADKNLKTGVKTLGELEAAKLAAKKGTWEEEWATYLLNNAYASQKKYETDKKDAERFIAKEKEEETRLQNNVAMLKSMMSSGNCNSAMMGPDAMYLTVVVMDGETNRPVTRASVFVTNGSGKTFGASETKSVSGEFKFIIPDPRKENYLRVKAVADDYKEKWSDITKDLLQTNTRFFTVYLDKKTPESESGEKMYGPFPVDLTGWKSTGLTLKKMGSFRVMVEGEISFLNEKNEKEIMPPTGYGYWQYFVLKAKIGDRLTDVGSKGGGYAYDGGVLELGAPRVARFIDGDANGKSGSWTVFVYSKDVIQQANTSSTGNDKPKTNTNPTANQDSKINNSLAFMEKLKRGEPISNRTANEIVSEIRFIIAEYKLVNAKTYFDYDASLNNVQLYHSSFGLVMPSVKADYDAFIDAIYSELKVKAKKN